MSRDIERLNRAQQIANIGNWDQDPVTDELWWSDQTYRIFGLAVQSGPVDFAHFLDMVHPDDRSQVVRSTEALLRSDSAPYSLEYRIRRADGDERIVYEEAVVDRDSAGTPVRIMGVVHDVTALRQVEEEHRRALADLETAQAEIRTLRGVIPICGFCRKVRDDKGNWHPLEAYINERTGEHVSHGLCPQCEREHYPDYAKESP